MKFFFVLPIKIIELVTNVSNINADDLVLTRNDLIAGNGRREGFRLSYNS